LAQAVKAEFPDIEIAGNAGGEYRTGAFEVTLDGKMLFSHFEQGRFPDSADIVRMVREDS
jgi:selT/selW/selH-like putative selenoprotein